MATVQGQVAPGFEPVRDVFQQQFDAGENVGASVAVYHRGKPVVDLWGGVAEEGTDRAWQRDTMAITYSTTKGMTATCVHILADRGQIDYDAPVATYWPEFAQNGKKRITVRHLLTHQAGMAPLPEGLSSEDMLDWEKVIHGIEQQVPAWEPGTGAGYHAVTFGYLNGEVVRRVSGKSVGTFLHDEVAVPLGLHDLFLGAPADAEPRIAKLVSKFDTDPEARSAAMAAMGNGIDLTLMTKSMSPADQRLNDILDSPAGHQAEIPAVSLVATARDLARVYACLANYGELDGVRILSEKTVRTMSQVSSILPDKVIILPIAFSMGYMNGQPLWPMGDEPTSFGHPGFGGSIGFADPVRELGFGFVPNAMTLGLTGAGRASSLADAARSCIAAQA
jgi:CubicO group peptidase (beta-lactamase class C family)